MSRLRTTTFLIALAGILGGSACAHRISDFNLGMDQVLAGNDAAAEALFISALDDPDDARRARGALNEIGARKARALIDSDPDAALAIYADMLAADPYNHRARMGAGRVLELEHRFDEAITVLSENQDCQRCVHQLAEVYEMRGRQRLAVADFEGAIADYHKSMEIEESAGALIDLSEVYTIGHYGTAAGAAESLKQAHDLLSLQNTTLQELWAVERRDLAVLAASKHEFAVVDMVLAIEDPRVALDQVARAHALLDVRMDVAFAYTQHEEYERGLEQGRSVVAGAAEQLPEDQQAAFSERLIGLYSVGALHLMSIGESRDATRLLTEGMQLAPDNMVLRYQAALAVSAFDRRLAEKMMKAIPESTEHWHRVHALVQTGRAHHYLKQGRIEKAQTELAAAGEEYPDLLEVRLVRAEILAATRIDKLGKTDRILMRKHGEVGYPGGAMMRYAEALAELQWCRSRYAEESAQLDPFRMPGFGARLATLEGDISAFFPYKVRKLPKAPPRIRVTNASSTAIAFTVEGPGVSQSATLEAGKQETLVFDDEGVTHFVMGETELALVAEKRTLIDIQLGD